MLYKILIDIFKKYIEMVSKDELKEIDIKNGTCYYFDDIIRFWDRDIDFSDILLDGKLYKEKTKNILIHDISYKTLTVWCIDDYVFDKSIFYYTLIFEKLLYNKSQFFLLLF